MAPIVKKSISGGKMGILKKKIEKVIKSSQGEGNKYRKKRKESFSTHIYKVLKQIHPDLGISSRTMVIMNDFVKFAFENFAREAAQFAKSANKKTITEREIHFAVKLLLPKELGLHAINEGTKAMKLYISSRPKIDESTIPES